MGASPRWKVYSNEGEYLASCHYAVHAAAVVAAAGPGATIRLGHAKKDIAFTEVDSMSLESAANSYDFAAEQCHIFEAKRKQELLARWKQARERKILRCNWCGWQGWSGFRYNNFGEPRCPSCNSGNPMIKVKG